MLVCLLLLPTVHCGVIHFNQREGPIILAFKKCAHKAKLKQALTREGSNAMQ